MAVISIVGSAYFVQNQIKENIMTALQDYQSERREWWSQCPTRCVLSSLDLTEAEGNVLTALSVRKSNCLYIFKQIKLFSIATIFN
jgi:hypothetical protein